MGGPAPIRGLARKRASLRAYDPRRAASVEDCGGRVVTDRDEVTVVPGDDQPALTTVFERDRPAARELRRSRLVVVEGPDAGRVLDVDKERITIGRSVVCDLVLADKAISATHFEIRATEHGHLLCDLDSTNGLYAAGLRIREAVVPPGTPIRAGQTTLRIEAAAGSVRIDLHAADQFGKASGRSVRMREVFAAAAKVAPTELTILVTGETGTGKEVMARAIHSHSRRAKGPFVVQDCSAIPKDLIESTLFGHERGSFTGATERHRGSFEMANGGTLFLDEIGELDLVLQPKLLRALESHEVQRIGASKPSAVDVRVVAATNRDLRAMINEGTFREDLYYRLSVVQLVLPPLRERREDIPILAEQFLAGIGQDGRRFTISAEALERLYAYPWPGNVRELRNALERAASLADSTVFGSQDFEQILRPLAGPTVGPAPESLADAGLSFKDAKQRVIDAFEAAYLRGLVARNGGNITHSAREAGLTRYHLRELLKRHGIWTTGE